jgi:hypothetical protein
VRFVTHLDVNAAQIDAAIATVTSVTASLTAA